MRRRLRGFSLAELVIWSALLGLLTLVLINLIIPAMRLAARTQIRLGLSQAALAVAHQLQADVESSAVAGILTPAEGAVIQPIAGLTGSGALQWAPQWIVYWRDADVCWRKVALPGDLSDRLPQLPGPDQLSGLRGVSGARRQARGVREFSLAPGEGSTLRLHLVVEDAAPGREKPERLVWDQVLRLENSL